MFLYPTKEATQFVIKQGNQSNIINENSGEINIDYSTKIEGQQLQDRYVSSKVANLRRLDIKYFGGEQERWFRFLSSLQADIDGNVYQVIDEKENLCMTIVDQRDFDGNGSRDVTTP